jgi:hypothetical protein
VWEAETTSASPPLGPFFLPPTGGLITKEVMHMNNQKMSLVLGVFSAAAVLAGPVTAAIAAAAFVAGLLAS